MINHISTFFEQFASIKVISTSVFALATFLADEMAAPKSWEDVSLKVLLLLSVGALVRQLQSERKESKDEIAKLREDHKNEIIGLVNKTVSALEDNTKGLSEVTSATVDQTTYYKTVARNLLDQKINAGDNRNSKPTIP